jgi:hypothetical protein
MGDARQGIAHFAFWRLLCDICVAEAAKISLMVSKSPVNVYNAGVGPLSEVASHMRKSNY